jgi:preprotein translocase subunit SecG
LPLFLDFWRNHTIMLTFLLVIHGLLALALVGVILMQKSEGGGLTTGTSSGGLVSARGAADLLTRSTAILATLFIVSSLGLAMLAASGNRPKAIDTTLARPAEKSGPLGAPTEPEAPPIAPVLPAPGTLPAPSSAPPADAAPTVPLAQ